MNEKKFELGLFEFPRVPENLGSGEIIIGSIYRELGLSGVSEAEVSVESRLLKERLRNGFPEGEYLSPSKLNFESFAYLVKELISTPKLGSQKGNEALFLYPLVPAISRYSNVARYKGNPWNPGAYFVNMVYRGAGSKAFQILESFRDALDVQGKNGKAKSSDDVWATFIQAEFMALLPNTGKPFKKGWTEPKLFPDLSGINCPARLLASDLPKLVSLKTKMTRRRWISVIEAYLRFMLPLDTLWICRMHKLFHGFIERSYDGLTTEEIVSEISAFSFFEEGKPRSEIVSYYAKEFGKGEIINQRLYRLAESKGLSLPGNCSVSDIQEFILKYPLIVSLREVIEHKKDLFDHIDREGIDRFVGKGKRANNIAEFLTYTPGRRNTANEALASYDQGYWYKKSGSARNATWVFSMGAASILTMVYLCSFEEHSDVVGVSDIIDFLSNYGIKINHKDFGAGSIGGHLRKLGLVIDSPDSEGGIVVINPFKVN